MFKIVLRLLWFKLKPLIEMSLRFGCDKCLSLDSGREVMKKYVLNHI